MGLRHGTLRHTASSSSLLLSHDGAKEEAAAAPVVARRATLAELLIPKCLKVDKKGEEGGREEWGGRKEIRKPTLEEWFLSSPSPSPSPGHEVVDSFLVQHRKQSPKVCPLNSSLGYEQLISSTTGDSFAATDEGLMALRDGHGHGRGEEQEEVLVSFSRSGSRQRRVSFRLPEEGDIHIIHCHGD